MDNLNQNQLATIHQNITRDQIQLSEKIGALKATDFIKKLVTVTEIKVMAEIKESKQYKGLMVVENGEVVTVTTWDEFCRHLGLSREKVDQDILNLSMLGEDFWESSQRMGVGYRELRKIRNLPEESRELIIQGEAVKAEDREGLIDLLQEISVKHAADKAATDKKIADLIADAEAKNQLIENKNNKIDDLDTKLNRRRAPDQAVLVEQEAEQEALVLMQTATSEFIAAVSKYNADMNAATEISSSPYVAEQYHANVVMTYQRIADQSTALGVHVDFQEMVSPAWATTQASDEAN